MTEQELRDKIVEVLKKKAKEQIVVNGNYLGDLQLLNLQQINAIADALIAAGLKFDVSYSFTAAFNSVQAERERDLERRLTAAEHRAEVAERAARDLIAYYCGYTIQSDIDNSLRVALQQAEKELAEGKKDE